jgi:hypothetical protein
MTARQEKGPRLEKSDGDPEEPQEYKQTPVASIVAALLVVAAITIAIFAAKGYYSKREEPPPKIVATAIEPHSEMEEARERAEAEVQRKAAEKMEAEKEKRIFAGRLEIRNVRVKKTKAGEITVSGSILNKGRREVIGVELTIYCLDAEDRPLCEKKIAVAPAAGGPLRKYQRLPFKTEIGEAPEATKDVQVLVSDMESAD